VKVLRMVDGDKPTMGFIYEAMDQTKEAIKAAYGDKRQKYLPLWRIMMKDGTNISIDLYMQRAIT